MTGWLALAVVLVVGAASWAATGALRRALLRGGILDRPNARSSHSRPVPRGGGLALLTVTLLAWLALAAAGLAAAPGFWATLASAALLAAVSWVDDLRGLPMGPRLFAQLATVMLCLGAMGDAGRPLHGLLPVWLDLPLTALVWLWFVNLYNFMDGIDGIAGVETLALGLGLAALAALAQAESTAPLPLALAAAAAGFLVWNWAPARIFLGDVGSVPLGFLLGWLLLLLADAGAWAAAVILPGYFLGDATLTLLRRALRGGQFWQPHREHFYQRAVQAGRSHAEVSGSIALLNLALIGLALLSWLWQPWIPLLAAAAAIAALLHRFARGGGRAGG